MVADRTPQKCVPGASMRGGTEAARTACSLSFFKISDASTPRQRATARTASANSAEVASASYRWPVSAAAGALAAVERARCPTPSNARCGPASGLVS